MMIEVCRQGFEWGVAPGQCCPSCIRSRDNPCQGTKCAKGFHCESQQVECVTAPCNPIGVCVADVDCSLVKCALPVCEPGVTPQKDGCCDVCPTTTQTRFGTTSTGSLDSESIGLIVGLTVGIAIIAAIIVAVVIVRKRRLAASTTATVPLMSEQYI